LKGDRYKEGFTYRGRNKHSNTYIHTSPESNLSPRSLEDYKRHDMKLQYTGRVQRIRYFRTPQFDVVEFVLRLM